jgi:hypothetical protein
MDAPTRGYCKLETTTVKPRKNGPVRLRFDDGQVFVTPEDYNIFLMESRKAIDALESARDTEEWARRVFDDFVPRIHNWCVSRADKISACYFTGASGGGWKLFVVSIGEYDSTLGMDIAELELMLADNEWPTDALQLPFGNDEELNAYFDPNHSILIYADPKAASTKS